LVNVRFIPTTQINIPEEDSFISQKSEIVLGVFNNLSLQKLQEGNFKKEYQGAESSQKLLRFNSPFDLALSNDLILNSDYEYIKSAKNVKEKIISLTRLENIRHIDLDSRRGPIFIDENVNIGSFAVIEGPCYIGEGSIIRPLTHIRPGTSIGKYCVVGGEVKRSIIDDFSNKSHFGYIGDSYIGRYCNLGAGTSNSNMKNTVGNISTVNSQKSRIETKGKRFMGIVMGDYCKIGIYSKFNAGSKIGAFSNLFGNEIHDKYIKPFTFGSKGVYRKYDLIKAIEVEERFAKLKSSSFSDQDRIMAQSLFNKTHAK
jgi:UDP-N-acetylglucosamine diphosphorylase/glucosamine-1-phosphate N-acetyltransferase